MSSSSSSSRIHARQARKLDKIIRINQTFIGHPSLRRSRIARIASTFLSYYRDGHVSCHILLQIERTKICLLASSAIVHLPTLCSSPLFQSFRIGWPAIQKRQKSGRDDSPIAFEYNLLYNTTAVGGIEFTSQDRTVSLSVNNKMKPSIVPYRIHSKSCMNAENKANPTRTSTPLLWLRPRLMPLIISAAQSSPQDTPAMLGTDDAPLLTSHQIKITNDHAIASFLLSCQTLAITIHWRPILPKIIFHCLETCHYSTITLAMAKQQAPPLLRTPSPASESTLIYRSSAATTSSSSSTTTTTRGQSSSSHSNTTAEATQTRRPHRRPDGTNDKEEEQYDNDKQRRPSSSMNHLLWRIRHANNGKTRMGLLCFCAVYLLAMAWLYVYSQISRRDGMIPTTNETPNDSIRPNQTATFSSSPNPVVQLPPVALPTGELLSPNQYYDDWDPDFGGLELIMGDIGHRREIWFHGHDVDEHEFWAENPYESHYSAYVMQETEMRERVWHARDEQNTCEMVEWQDKEYPTCNIFHEFDFASSYKQKESHIVGGGFFRKVFKGESHGEMVVMKLAAVTSSNKPLAKYDWESNRLEAVVNNALSPNPHIVDMYSYCGLSLLSENMERGDLHDLASPHYERCEEDDEDLPENPWELRNNLSPLEKVELALQMAEALRILHHHKGGAIVHNDVQLAQFLRDKNGRVKLTDFNMATILQYNSNQPEEPCKFVFEKTPGMVSRRSDWPHQNSRLVFSHNRCFMCKIFSLRKSIGEILSQHKSIFSTSDQRL
eukprot:scaffold6750_cov160-Amphora_coffeaeformis.AAC.7